MTIAAAEGTLVALSDDGVLEITLNRPEHGNSIRAETVPEFVRMLQAVAMEPAVHCVVLQGAGKHFNTGGDLQAYSKELAGGPESLQRSFQDRLENAGNLVKALLAIDRPVIARCRGVVAGAGLMFALCADWVIADDTAQFMFSHRRVGLSPDGGVSYLLPKVVGARKAAQLILGGALVGAEEGLSLGLVTQLVAGDQLDETVAKLAGGLARTPQLAMRTAKRLIYSAGDHDLVTHLEAERQGIVRCVGDPDFAEGVSAFMERRKPSFR
jgi:2-(1,2-epoxy-1,2-dihydrophenyl)acetyl-CoA isomerase